MAGLSLAKEYPLPVYSPVNLCTFLSLYFSNDPQFNHIKYLYLCEYYKHVALCKSIIICSKLSISLLARR